MKRKVFRSRVSVLLISFFLLPILPVFIAIVRSGNIFNPGFYVLIGICAFVVFIFSGVRYEITDKELMFSTWGTCKASCPLSKILSVERSYNPLSSPAMSLKRLKICFKKGYKWPFTLISPVREQEFLETLKTYNPNIYIRVNNKKGWWRIWDWDI